MSGGNFQNVLRLSKQLLSGSECLFPDLLFFDPSAILVASGNKIRGAGCAIKHYFLNSEIDCRGKTKFV